MDVDWIVYPGKASGYATVPFPGRRTLVATPPTPLEKAVHCVLDTAIL